MSNLPLGAEFDRTAPYNQNDCDCCDDGYLYCKKFKAIIGGEDKGECAYLENCDEVSEWDYCEGGRPCRKECDCQFDDYEPEYNYGRELFF